jgi:hypothetical protein
MVCLENIYINTLNKGARDDDDDDDDGDNNNDDDDDNNNNNKIMLEVLFCIQHT